MRGRVVWLKEVGLLLAAVAFVGGGSPNKTG
jgi:hypothetical protein